MQFIERGNKIVSNAIRIDERGDDYRAAFNEYMRAIEVFIIAMKYAPTEMLQQRIESNLNSYVTRAEELKIRLASGRTMGKQTVLGTNDMNVSEECDEECVSNSVIAGMILDLSKNCTTLEDVIGLEEAKGALREAITFPRVYKNVMKDVGLTTWSGILLFGPPGTGKTHLVHAIASEEDVTFFDVKASDIMSKWQGESTKIVRSLFQSARRSSPSIIFIDEIEAMLPDRSNSHLTQSMKQVINEFLVNMSMIDDDQENSVVVLGATNIPWELDEASCRRFQRRVYIGMPDVKARMRLFSLQTGDRFSKKLYRKCAQLTEGYTGSDIKSVVNQVKYDAIRKLQDATHFYWDDKVDKFRPCSSGRDGAIEMNCAELKDGDVTIREPTFSDFRACIDSIKPTTNRKNIEKLKRWGESIV